ncbi:hypothetical protein D0864_00238 [Hortaea werneckii]|uniref:Peptidase A1 domain-containing protein n=1 Tax=Hortaea werneckii TaxID=91943 RepID=A0A3M7HLY6_HORWE|nr:hypothetical protein D0864_00238 [Hortaea werneckii]
MPSRAAVASLTSLAFVSQLCDAFSFDSIWSRDIRSHPRRIERRDDDGGENKTVIPAPISVAPSQYWDGIASDGPWSSFALQVGTPAQNVRVFASTASTFTWTVGAEGCPPDYVTDCEDSRGFLFLSNESLTWVPNSIFSFDLEQNLGMDTTGNAGFDTVTLDWQGSGGPTVDHSTVFSIATSIYWLGEFGLSPWPTNFTTFVDPQPSFMTQLKTNNTIPSISYGYTAGNQYRLDKVYGSLTLGAYDTNRFTPTNVSFQFYEDQSRDLLVNIRSITTDGGDTDLLPDGQISAFVDSTVPMIWLPESACTAFEEAFNLTYDEDWQLYLVNDSQHEALTAANPSVTFTLSPNSTGGETVDITLPYGAFDLQVNYPLITNPNTSYYFPLQRAQNDTQYTLGRTFLQEAYLIADYERQNFTIAPCEWDETKIQNTQIATIRSPDDVNAGSDSSDESGGISSGAIAGVVIGIVAAIAILGALLFLLRRKKKNDEKRRLAELEAKDPSSIAAKTSGDSSAGGGGEGNPFISAPLGGELAGSDSEIHELTAPHKPPPQEMDSPYKMDPNKAGYSEMESGEYFGPGKGFAHEIDGAQKGSGWHQQEIFEMPGSEVQELAGSEVRRDEKR